MTSLYDEANELLLNDQFDNALKLFSEEIEKKTSESIVYNCYIGRAQTFLKLKNYSKVLEEAENALAMDKKDSRAYHKKGIALFHLKNFKEALDALQEGQKLGETPTKKSLFDEWINKCRAEIPVETESVSVKAENQNDEMNKNDNPVPIPTPVVKHEWYQSESQVTVSVLAKNRSANDVKIISTENTLVIQGTDDKKIKIDFNFNLEHPILSEQTQIKFMSSKIEIKLKKCEPLQWKVFNITSSDLSKRLEIINKKPDYPTSSKKPKNWDAIAKEVDAEEEKVEGDAALNKLFRDVYANGSDETRKAMNKSFVESGGTTLSTNWAEVGSKKLEINPPDGMEWKKY